MGSGINIAEATQRQVTHHKLIKSSVPDINIFISHIRIDKEAAINISNYIIDAGFDVYIDINDKDLQSASIEKNPFKITRCIEEGISNCSHIICLVSNETYNSWWVPYEIGFAKKSYKYISTLLLKDVEHIPDYLKISEILYGTKSLNNYLKKLWDSNIKKSYAHNKLGTIYEGTSHPLDHYLQWNK